LKTNQQPILLGALFTVVIGAMVLVFNATRTKRATPFAATVVSTGQIKHAPAGPAPEGMVWIPGGEFEIGSDDRGEAPCRIGGVTRDAQPIHRVYLDGFWMDRTEVTNEEFERFVKAAGYVTMAAGINRTVSAVLSFIGNADLVRLSQKSENKNLDPSKVS
jgi:formylglycine-generating enzyme required for sulfatase activity